MSQRLKPDPEHADITQDEASKKPVSDYVSHKQKKSSPAGASTVRSPAGWLYRSAVILLWLPMTLLFGVRIKRDSNLKKIRGPIIVLGNHPSYLDPFIVALALPRLKINFVAANLFFRKPFLGWLLRTAGAIPKIQFRSDARALKQMLHVLHNDGALGIFPEGQRSLDGCPQPIDDTIARLIKKTGSQVVIVKISGAYLTWPRWSESKFRPGRIEVETSLILDGDSARTTDIEKIAQMIRYSLHYDEYDWQSGMDRKASYFSFAPAKGLHNICHQCPDCLQNMVMKSARHRIFCGHCSSSFTYDKHGCISRADAGSSKRAAQAQYKTDGFVPGTIHQWHLWQQKLLEKTIENEDYFLEIKVKTEAAGMTDIFKKSGSGTLRLDHNGLAYKGTDLEGENVDYICPVNKRPQFSADYGSRIEIAYDSGFWRFYPDQGQAVMLLADALDILDKKRQD